MIGLRLLCSLLVTSVASAQSVEWASMNNNYLGALTEYGEQGTPGALNQPGERSASAGIRDASGDVWVFGGWGLDASGNTGLLNDLWKWDGTFWTWAKGSSAIDQYGDYGTLGVAAGSNTPGAREGAIMWTDTAGDVWLFGGEGFAASGSKGHLNDLWKWDGTSWTWMGGSTTTDKYGVYGTAGVASVSNWPGSRSNATVWKDGNGTVWLFGGFGRGSSGSSGYLNDLWRWDDGSWTWMSGSGTVNLAPVRSGASPINPGGRSGVMGWTDSSGNLLLFGGKGNSSSLGVGYWSDMWKWDGSGWAIVRNVLQVNQAPVHGTMGVTSASNRPGGRHIGQVWKDNSGDVWIYGGFGLSGSGFSGSGYADLADLWKWDGANWTWISGSTEAGITGTYTTKGVASSAHLPEAKAGAVSWVDNNGDFWMFAGQSTALPQRVATNTLFKWDGSNWTWVGGVPANGASGHYGTKGVAAPTNRPGARNNALVVEDSNGNVWMFGGMGYGAAGKVAGYGPLNDLWKWDGTNWTWMSGGQEIYQPNVYGTLGVADPANAPGGRSQLAGWVDANGHLWIFGGMGFYALGIEILLNDLWKWDGTNWTWMGGSSTPEAPGTYGVKGVAAASNQPGARLSPAFWTDNSGNAWLFGGFGWDGSGNLDVMNDLWKWDGMHWTWVSGSSNVFVFGTYGTQGQASASNVPGGRALCAFWKDSNDDLWLFGGYGNTSNSYGHMNDLWKWDGTNWTWVHGYSDPSLGGTYGTLGVSSPGNTPGARYLSTSWTDDAGNFWLFGGLGMGTTNFIEGDLNDLWKWDGTTWTWMSGSTDINSPLSVGSLGVFLPDNTPPGCHALAPLKHASGEVTLFGGYQSNYPFYTYYSPQAWKLDTYPASTTWTSSSWDNGAPDAEKSARIVTSAATPGSFTCRNLEVNTGGQLEVSTGTTLTVKGSIINKGDGLAGTGTVQFDKSGETIEVTGNVLSFEGDLEVTAGTTLITQNKVTLKASSASSYGTLTGEGTISGVIKAEAWLDLDGTPNDGRYYLLGSPVATAVLSDFAEDGSILRSENTSDGTIWEWDAANAEWIAAGDGLLSSMAVNGKGYAVYAGNNTWGSHLRSGPGTIELSGDAVSKDVLVPLYYNDGQNSSAQFFTGTSLSATQGWNLVANPYIAQYDWDNPTVPANVGTAKYVWDGTNYVVYNNGAGSGSRYIPPFQAFWVQLTTNPGTFQNLQFEAARRTSGQAAQLQKTNSQTILDGVDLHVYGSDPKIHDEVYIGFDNNATTEFDNRYDAWKLLNDVSAPNLYTTSGDEAYAISRVPYGGQRAFPVSLRYSGHGEQMKLSVDASSLTGFASVKLEDLKEKVMIDLLKGDYSFTHDSSYLARFVLHFGDENGSPEDEETGTWVWSDRDGIMVRSDSELSRIEVFNAAGQLIATRQGGTTVSVPVSQRGVFLVVIHSPGTPKTFKVVR